MKFKKLCSVAVVTAIAAGALAPVAANADVKTLGGTGKVTYEEDTTSNKPEDPELEDGKDIDPDDKKILILKLTKMVDRSQLMLSLT